MERRRSAFCRPDDKEVGPKFRAHSREPAARALRGGEQREVNGRFERFPIGLGAEKSEALLGSWSVMTGRGLQLVPPGTRIGRERR